MYLLKLLLTALSIVDILILAHNKSIRNKETKVSTDWLLGRDGSVKSFNADVATIGKYTGLSESAINVLHSICDKAAQVEIVSAIIAHGAFPSMIGFIMELKEAKIESESQRSEIFAEKPQRTIDGERIVRGVEHEIFLEYMLDTCLRYIVGDISQAMIDKEYPID